jgi:hypothetical protein
MLDEHQIIHGVGQPNITPEGAALSLLQLIARAENKVFANGRNNVADRRWILDTYRECRMAVEGKEPVSLIIGDLGDEAETG